MNFVSYVLAVIATSALDYHTYVGIALGALFSSFWLVIYNFLKAKLVKKVHEAAPVVAEVEAAVKVVEAEAAPVIAMVEAAPAVQDAQPK